MSQKVIIALGVLVLGIIGFTPSISAAGSIPIPPPSPSKVLSWDQVSSQDLLQMYYLKLNEEAVKYQDPGSTVEGSIPQTRQVYDGSIPQTKHYYEVPGSIPQTLN